MQVFSMECRFLLFHFFKEYTAHSSFRDMDSNRGGASCATTPIANASLSSERLLDGTFWKYLVNRAKVAK